MINVFSGRNGVAFGLARIGTRRARPRLWSVNRREPLSRNPRILLAGIVAAVAVVGGCATSTAGAGQPTIGVTLETASNPFFLAEANGIQAAAANIGAKALVQYANQDVPTQSDQIDSFIRQKVRFIVIDAVDSEGIGPAVLRAKKAKIPVVAIDVAAAAADATVTSDNVLAGFQACQYLAESLGNKATIAIVDGQPVSAISDRMAGCRKVLAAAPGIQVVANQRGDDTRDKGLTVATNILTAHPDVQGFFGVNDPTAAGIELAAQQKGVTVKITGVDGAKQATDSIGRGMIVGTAAQDPGQLGQTGVQMGSQLAAGKPVTATPQLIPTKLVNKDNLGSYTAWG
jgi:ribose transport system substrate-binding protein